MSRAEEYVQCRKDGMTCQSIAELYGVSRQAVSNAIKRYENGNQGKPYPVAFHGLREWMEENNVRVGELEEKTGKNLRHALGIGRLSNDKVNAILRVTGLTYEQAFKKVSADERGNSPAE